MTDREQQRKELLARLIERERQLAKAEAEAAIWLSGKYKNNSNAMMAAQLVESIRQEVKHLKMDIKLFDIKDQ